MQHMIDGEHIKKQRWHHQNSADLEIEKEAANLLGSWWTTTDSSGGRIGESGVVKMKLKVGGGLYTARGGGRGCCR
jgi:hypothetical protein